MLPDELSSGEAGELLEGLGTDGVEIGSGGEAVGAVAGGIYDKEDGECVFGGVLLADDEGVGGGLVTKIVSGGIGEARGGRVEK